MTKLELACANEAIFIFVIIFSVRMCLSLFFNSSFLLYFFYYHLFPLYPILPPPTPSPEVIKILLIKTYLLTPIFFLNLHCIGWHSLFDSEFLEMVKEIHTS